MFLEILLYILVPLLVLLILWSKRKLRYLQNRNILCLEPSFPLGNMNGIGSTIHIVERTQEIYEAFKKSDKIAGFYSMLRPTIMITDLDLIKNVFIKDFKNFTNRGVYHNADADPVSAHIFAIEGADWKFVRNNLTPTFTSGKIKNMFGTVVDMSEELIKTISTSKRYEIRDLCNRYIADIIGNVAFGLDCQGLKSDDSKLLEASYKIFHLSGLESLRFLFLNSFPEFGRKFNMRLIDPSVSSFFIQTTKDAIKYRKNNNIKREDFLNSLINLMETGTIDGESIENDKKLSFNQIVAEAFLFFFAGFETSSTTMSLALFEIAANPKVQRKLRDEIQSVAKKNDGKILYESIADMTYLSQVLNETLRKYSTVGTIIRCANDDYKVPGTDHIIVKGTQIWIPTYAIHNDSDIYPNPSVFDPERFTAAEIKKRHNFAFIPFGDGPRNCIGLRFAQLQIKYGIARIVQEFEINISSDMIMPFQLNRKSFIIEAVGGIRLDFKKN